MDARVASLRARLTEPRTRSAAREQRYRERLAQAIDDAAIEGWEQPLRRAFEARLTAELRIGSAPEWLHAGPQRELIASIAALRGDHRALALRLLSVRAGPPPWDLRDDPSNRAVIAAMRARGLDPRPWVDGLPPRVAETSDGRRWTLALEPDPLEIFRMGAHFSTCLSPGQCNFFSVFSNAADIDKRVLYARDERGNVVGRALIALTVELHMMVFHPYCHDRYAGFDEMVRDFASELARAVGTIVVSRGTVVPRVASDWYDDGPRDLCGVHPALREGSALRERLCDIGPSEVLGALQEAFAPRGLDELTLPLALELPELRERPLLALPLIARLERASVVSPSSALSASSLADLAGEPELARRLLARCVVPSIEHDIARGIDPDHVRLDVIARVDPARLLRIARAVRRRGVRCWEDEPNGWRLMLVAEAYERLHRRNRALSIYRELVRRRDSLTRAPARRSRGSSTRPPLDRKSAARDPVAAEAGVGLAAAGWFGASELRRGRASRRPRSDQSTRTELTVNPPGMQRKTISKRPRTPVMTAVMSTPVGSIVTPLGE